MFNYQKICQSLLKRMPQRTRDVIERRFGLKKDQTETLESIGESYGITRERVRQIEADGLSRLKPGLKEYQKVFKYFTNQLRTFGDLKKEDLLLEKLGGPKSQNQISFLLTIGEPFKRFSESEDLHSFWTTNPNSFNLAKKVINSFAKKLKEAKKPLPLNPNLSSKRLPLKVLTSFIEISKKITQGPEELYGLKDWPEINPRGVKDKAYLVFKKEQKPLHFTEVARFINEGKALPQTVHNELIKDHRFVLVGRGLYALSEWGYQPGLVKDVILRTLKESKKPLTKDEIIEKVLKQRFVRENTILLNLQDRKYFIRDSNGRYTIKEI